MVPPQAGAGLALPPAPILPLLVFSLIGQVWDHVPGVPSKLLCMEGYGPTLNSEGNTCNAMMRNTGFEVRQVRIQILTLPFTTCVTLDEYFNYLRLGFFIY